jgi:hypothetical protein
MRETEGRGAAPTEDRETSDEGRLRLKSVSEASGRRRRKAWAGQLFHVSRRTVRVRLTMLYTALFLGCGTALLALTDLMMARLIHDSTGTGLHDVGHMAGMSVRHHDGMFFVHTRRLPQVSFR